jgi:tetratricopeptide (TPR) repeat protein
MVQVSKRLVVRKEVMVDNTQELITSLDVAMADYYCSNKDFIKGLSLYKDLIPNLPELEKQATINRFISYSLQYGQILMQEKKWAEAVEIYRDIMKNSGYPVNVYKNIGLCMKSMGNADLAIKFLKQFEEISQDKEDVYIYLADITYSDIKDNIKAIEYYEKALEKNPNNFSIYNMLGHLYSTCYQDKFKEKQIDYFMKAYNLAPNNRILVKNLAYVLGKFHEEQRADEFYAKLMYLNPTHSDLHSYGAYLVKHRRFSEGFKFLQHRFQKEDLKNVAFPQIFINNKKKRWSLKHNIKDKHILVHFEQGFGDTIMFARFIGELQKRCAKVSLVVQNGLVSLFENSKLGVDIYKESDIPTINYDYYIPMMDLPIVCETTSDNIPRAEGYLKVSKSKINAYKTVGNSTTGLPIFTYGSYNTAPDYFVELNQNYDDSHTTTTNSEQVFTISINLNKTYDAVVAVLLYEHEADKSTVEPLANIPFKIENDKIVASEAISSANTVYDLRIIYGDYYLWQKPSLPDTIVDTQNILYQKKAKAQTTF